MVKPVSVGTTARIIIPANPNRTSWAVNFVSTDIESGNTGRVHVEKGSPPTSVLQSPTQGAPLKQGDGIGESEAYAGDPGVYKGDIWSIASAADQRIWTDESYRIDQSYQE